MLGTAEMHVHKRVNTWTCLLFTNSAARVYSQKYTDPF